ncbi:hypothetical protein T06_11671, partial [Trichinella sp. T6]
MQIYMCYRPVWFRENQRKICFHNIDIFHCYDFTLIENIVSQRFTLNYMEVTESMASNYVETERRWLTFGIENFIDIIIKYSLILFSFVKYIVILGKSIFLHYRAISNKLKKVVSIRIVRRILYIMGLNNFQFFFLRLDSGIGNRNSNARKSQRSIVFLMECGKNLVDIVLQKWAASPPQSLPYTVRKAIEQIGTATSTERSDARKHENYIYRRCVFCGRKRQKKSHAAMNICAAAVNIVVLILALPNKGRSTDLLRQILKSKKCGIWISCSTLFHIKGLEKRSLFRTKKMTIELSLVSKCAE